MAAKKPEDTLTITALVTLVRPSAVVQKGESVTLPTAEAEGLVKRGFAQRITAQDDPAEASSDLPKGADGTTSPPLAPDP